jgi:DNA-directed RNA polymerase specialized sigma24 family protein
MAVQPELIAAAQAGDSGAIALLLERAQPDIRRYAEYNCRTASDVDELTIDEIAQSLSLSREAVKGRLHRARGLIREYLTG